MKRIHLLHIAALVTAAILLLTSFSRAQNQPVYKSEPFVRELGLQIGKLPLTANGLQRAVQSLGDSGVVLISFPGVWDTAGVGAIPEGITLKGWLFGVEIGTVNFEFDDSSGIAAYVEEALVGYATELWVTTTLTDYASKTHTWQSVDSVRNETETALGDKIDKDYAAYPGIPIPDYDAEIIIRQNDTTGITTVGKLPISDAVQSALNAKQDTLISGTNIKTINSESILGSGNISVAGAVDTVSEDGIATKPYVNSAIDQAVGETQEVSLDGGTTGQVLTKISNADYDFGWADATGGSGIPQDSLDKKLYAEFNTEYPQATVPSVDNYIPVLTGTGNQYSALGDLPISSAVSSALSGKQDALGFTPENVANKSTDTTLGTSNTLYPSQNAVKTYVDNAIELINNEGDARVPYMWVYLALDTIPDLTSFTPATDVSTETSIESNVISVSNYDVSYVSIITGGTDAEYRTKTGATWSNWGQATQLLKAVDSAQVRLTSSDQFETAVSCTLLIGGQDEIFTVTTEAEILPPNAPTLFVAYGGESEEDIRMTWTDPLIADSIRIYEGSEDNTSTMTWIASVPFGDETYNRTGRTANTTYWYAARSLSGELLSSFSNTDSATTLSSGGDTLGTNILVNGDMETPFSGGYNVWESRFGATVERSTEEVYAGDYSCKTITIGGGTGVATEVQYIPLESGKSYWVEGYIYIVSGAAIVVATVSGYGGAVLDVTKDQWVYFKFKVDATATSTHRLYFEEYGAGGNTTFYLDNLSIKELL